MGPVEGVSIYGAAPVADAHPVPALDRPGADHRERGPRPFCRRTCLRPPRVRGPVSRSDCPCRHPWCSSARTRRDASGRGCPTGRAVRRSCLQGCRRVGPAVRRPCRARKDQELSLSRRSRGRFRPGPSASTCLPPCHASRLPPHCVDRIPPSRRRRPGHPPRIAATARRMSPAD